MLSNGLHGRVFSGMVPLCVMAANYPSLWADYVEPFVVWHSLRESFRLVRPHLERAPQRRERSRKLLPEIAIKVER